MGKFPITINGKKLRDELDKLTNTERPKIIEAIATARNTVISKKTLSTMLQKNNKVLEGRIKKILN